MDNNHQSAVDLIQSGGAALGIEFGSTRIKASLIAPDTTPLASGSHGWENQLKDGVWTYDMEAVWEGLAACYASLAAAGSAASAWPATWSPTTPASIPSGARNTRTGLFS
jgi:hypothetical protein